MKRKIACVTLMNILLLSGLSARSQEGSVKTLYALSYKPTGQPPVDAYKIAELVRINAETGMGTRIGTVGADLDQYQWSADLAFAPDGTLWCVNGTRNSNNLIRIDIKTGKGTALGSTDSLVEGIAFDADGVLYAAHTGHSSWDNRRDNLIIINVETFTSLEIGQTRDNIDGLAIAPDGTLYGIDSGILLRINSTTGAATEIGDTGAAIYSITFSPDGTMYAAAGDGVLYSVNPHTAALTKIGESGFPYIAGLAYYSDIPPPITSHYPSLPLTPSPPQPHQLSPLSRPYMTNDCVATYETTVVWACYEDSKCYMHAIHWGTAPDFEIASYHMIGTDTSFKKCPAIYKDIVVWEDYRHGNADIYGYNLSTGEEFHVTADVHNQCSPSIWGDIVVWEDYRHGNADIYGYNLSTGEEFHVTADVSGQYRPKIHTNTIVWEDYRHGNADIYGYNLSTGEEFQITRNPHDQYRPAIHENTIVWEDRRHGNPDIYGHDLSIKGTFPIIVNPDIQQNPIICEDVIFFEEQIERNRFILYTFSIFKYKENEINDISCNYHGSAIYGEVIVSIWYTDFGGYINFFGPRGSSHTFPFMCKYEPPSTEVSDPSYEPPSTEVSDPSSEPPRMFTSSHILAKIYDGFFQYLFVILIEFVVAAFLIRTSRWAFFVWIYVVTLGWVYLLSDPYECFLYENTNIFIVLIGFGLILGLSGLNPTKVFLACLFGVFFLAFLTFKRFPDVSFIFIIYGFISGLFGGASAVLRRVALHQTDDIHFRFWQWALLIGSVTVFADFFSIPLAFQLIGYPSYNRMLVSGLGLFTLGAFAGTFFSEGEGKNPQKSVAVLTLVSHVLFAVPWLYLYRGRFILSEKAILCLVFCGIYLLLVFAGTWMGCYLKRKRKVMS